MQYRFIIDKIADDYIVKIMGRATATEEYSLVTTVLTSDLLGTVSMLLLKY